MSLYQNTSEWFWFLLMLECLKKSLRNRRPSEPDVPEEKPVSHLANRYSTFSVSVFQLRYDSPVNIEDAVFFHFRYGEASRIVYADETKANVNISFDEELDLGVGISFVLFRLERR